MDETSRQLVLVKHSLPEIQPDRPASEWNLSEEGRRRASTLANRLASYEIEHIFSSKEPKANQTASIVAERLGVPYEVVEGLHEHQRRNVKILSPGQYQRSIDQLLEKPRGLVFGEETAFQARERFRNAMGLVLGRDLDENIVVVSHGTVISLFVAELNNLEPYDLWRQLGLPSFVVLSRPKLHLQEVVGST